MKFDELDVRMRAFETGADFCVLPGMFFVFCRVCLWLRGSTAGALLG